MEYLMTYGWAILIIAVVLGALYYLGVFNTSNLAPRAQPGSCKVVRPNGPGTTTFINLAGVCTGQLPLFVGSFDGVSSYINIGHAASFNIINAITIAGWYKPAGQPSVDWTPLFGKSAAWYIHTNLASNYNIHFFQIYNSIGTVTATTSYTVGDNNWHYYVGTYDSATGNLLFYVDGVQRGNAITSGTLSSQPAHDMEISGVEGNTRYDNGQMSNVQLYNTSLSTVEIQGLYAEGIGGAPTRFQNLVGWWPLNGNANDYSGNGNNGAATSVVFTSTWTK